MRMLLVGAATVLLASACGGGDDDDGGSGGALDAAYDACSASLEEEMAAELDDPPEVSEVMELAEDGSELAIAIPGATGDTVNGVLISATECVLAETDAPADLVQRFGDAQPSGGQVGEYDDIELTWYLCCAQEFSRSFNAEFVAG